MNSPRIAYLSTVYDEHYHQVRGENIYRYLSWRKRRDLLACIDKATAREVIVLSPPPRASDRRHGRWLAPVETLFSTHRQLFCGNWDIPKMRIPLSWILYALHVLRHTRSGDILIMDNYELGQVIAVSFTKIFRKVTVLLDYEDGYHLIHRGWLRHIGTLAEMGGRRFVKGALLAHPSLARRLPSRTPSIVVPGFYVPSCPTPARSPTSPVHFLYSGSLDSARGVDILLRALHHLPPCGWRLDITGDGPMRLLVEDAISKWPRPNQVAFHGSVSETAYNHILAMSHVGLNCQRSDDPIASVTFPSKVFTYVSAGLLVISTRASAVDEVLARSCIFVSEDDITDLAAAMACVMVNYEKLCNNPTSKLELDQYSIPGTAHRLVPFFGALK